MAEADIGMDIKDEFSNAAKFLQSVTAQLSSSQLLEFYAYYKQATQGKCDSARPSMFNMKARQKWDAWSALGDLNQEGAMAEYVALLTKLFPDWQENSLSTTSGWVAVSSMAKQEPDLADSEKRLSDWVRDGDKAKVRQHSNNHIINQLDGEGLGPIHWAADRGNLDMLKFIVTDLKADLELKDQEGQTALHYAASCGHADIVKYLVDLGANTEVKDSDGATPLDVASELDIVNILS